MFIAISKRGEENIEIDLLVVNDTDMVAIVCKSTLCLDDVNDHLTALVKLKKLLPAYAGNVQSITPDPILYSVTKYK